MHKLAMFGLNYRTANIDIREKLAVTNDEMPAVLNRLMRVCREVLVISTCNRIEVYCITSDIQVAINMLCDFKNVCPRNLSKYCYIYEELECVKHLFNVVSGLDSMILGETEIVSQVKNAIDFAKSIGSIGTQMIGIMQLSLNAAKEVRSSTGITNVAISAGNALAKIIMQSFTDISQQSILFIGAGQMMQNVIPHFVDFNYKEKIIVNRTYQKANIIAQKYKTKVVDISELNNVIKNATIIVICAHGDNLILDVNTLSSQIANSDNLLVIDLSVPLLTDLKLRKYSHIKLYTIDDIATIVDVGLESRKAKAHEAQSIIDAKLRDYNKWIKKRAVVPLIRALRDNADEMRQEVLQSAQKSLQNGVAADEVLQQFSIQLMNKLLHSPTVNLLATEDQKQDELFDLIGYLYGVNADSETRERV